MTSIALRRLTPAGLVSFRSYLDDAAANPTPYGPPAGLLRDEEFTTLVASDMFVDPGLSFGSRLAMAQYLWPILSRANVTDPGADTGLWSWLAVAYFDQLCPLVGKVRQVRQRARYLLNDGSDTYNFQRAARHLVFSPVYVFGLHPDAPPLALLCQAPSVHPDMAEQLASYQQLIGLASVVGAVDALYFDPAKRTVRLGATDRKQPGTIRRLITVCAQLDLTFDLASLSAPDLLRLLPKEFARWR